MAQHDGMDIDITDIVRDYLIRFAEWPHAGGAVTREDAEKRVDKFLKEDQ